DDGSQSDPLVPAQPTDVSGGVDTETLDPKAPGSVADHVHRQQTSRTELEFAVDPKQDADQTCVPQRFVQERRMVGRIRECTGRLMGGIDLNGPRKIRRLAVQLLVEPVAPSSDR